MTRILRRSNGSIVGSSIIPGTTNPSVLSGIWSKKEYNELFKSNKWTTFENLTVSITIDSTSTTASFQSVVLTGNAGTIGGFSGGAGGTYSIINNNGNGGGIKGGDGYGTGGFGGGGTSGGAIGNGYGNPAYSTNVNGIWTAAALAGFTGNNTFGRGGIGGNNYGNAPENGQFPGGGGGGRQYIGGDPPGSGGNGGVMIQITRGYTDYATSITTTGTYTIPSGTIYVKIWAIGKGGTGGSGVGGANSAAGGGAGGTAYCNFRI